MSLVLVPAVIGLCRVAMFSDELVDSDSLTH